MIFQTNNGNIIYKGGFVDGLFSGSGILNLNKNLK